MAYFIIDTSANQSYLPMYHQAVDWTEDPNSAAAFLVFGGDGAMLDAINRFHYLQKPFIGVNTGTRGYLMNNTTDPSDFRHYLVDVKLHRLWMLEAEVSSANETFTAYAFNDFWIERRGNQTLRMQITLDDILQPSVLIGDGILFCTPQGSTGYNLALRGKAVAPDVQVLQVTPISCVVEKSALGSIILSDRSIIEVTFMQIEKRPAQFICDGMDRGSEPVQHIRVRKSNATVQLGMVEEYSFPYKVLSWQLKF